MGDKFSLIVKNYESGNYLLNLYDMRGNIVYESFGNFDNSRDISINVNKPNLCSGLYYYRILIGYQTLTGKILIQN